MPLNDEATATERKNVLSEAFDKIDAATPDATPEPATAVETATAEPSAPQDGAPPPASERPRDERGRFVPASETATKPEPVKAETATKAPEPAVKTETPAPEKPVETATEPVKAPQAFRPIAREEWAKTPPAVQQEILRREKEITARLQEDSEPVKAWKAFQQVVQPYESMIRDAGASHPLQVVQNLLQTARVLRYGAPGEKAQMAARIVKDFGVSIEDLDSALAGQLPAQDTIPQYDPETFAAQVEQRLQERLAKQAQQMAAQRQEAEFASFAKAHEFANDVKNDILAFQEAARRRGVVMSLDDAYSRAVALDPDISKVLEQRKAAEAAKAQVASMQKTKAAASSIKTQPTAAPAAQPTDRRALLAAKYDELAGR